jgi:UDP-glucose 4-epimerase
MRILVTGGAGFIGSHLVDDLVRRDAGEVAVLDNLHRGRIENLGKSLSRLTFVQGDIRDEAVVRAAMKRVDIVFHLAAQSNVVGSELDKHYCTTTNVGGTRLLLQAACDAGVKTFVFTSSREVYGDPEKLPVQETAPLRAKNTYGMSKVAGEAECRAMHRHGLFPVIVRLANVYGPRDTGRVIPLFLDLTLRDEPLTIYGGGQTIDFIWIETVVECLRRAAKLPCGTEPINIGSGKPTTVLELAQRIKALMQSRSPLNILPGRDYEVSGFAADNLRMRTELQVLPPADPLADLRQLVEITRSVAEHTNRAPVVPSVAEQGAV